MDDDFFFLTTLLQNHYKTIVFDVPSAYLDELFCRPLFQLRPRQAPAIAMSRVLAHELQHIDHNMQRPTAVSNTCFDDSSRRLLVVNDVIDCDLCRRELQLVRQLPTRNMRATLPGLPKKKY